MKGEMNMTDIILTVESGSDIPQELAQRYGIYVVPMHITFGDDTKDDGAFPVTDICDYYSATGKIPKTSGCTPDDFITVFDKIHREHPDKSILHLAYSAVTTCSYQSAVIAAEGRDYIECVDTKHVAAGQTAVAARVAQELEKHPEWSLKEAAQHAEEISASVKMCFMPKDLSYLRAGGRVSNAAALIGAVLNIHPVIELQNGYLIAAKKMRGKMQRLIPKLIEEYVVSNNMDRKTIWLEYTTGLPEESKQIAEETARRLGFQTIGRVYAGGVITTHGGPGAFAIAGYSH